MKSYRPFFVLDDNYVYPFLMTLGSLSANSAQPSRVILVNIQDWSGGSPLVSPENIGIIKKVCSALGVELEVIDVEVPIPTERFGSMLKLIISELESS
jgi:hypothetical protein